MHADNEIHVPADYFLSYQLRLTIVPEVFRARFSYTVMVQAANNPQIGGIFDIEVPGNWVLPDDQFWLAIVKPPFAGFGPIVNDTTRPEAMALANTLFSLNNNGQYPIAINAPAKNAIVLFPEFAFGSDDFGRLDILIRAQTRPTMVFAGFGAVGGDKLRAMIQEDKFLCGWQAGIEAIDANRRYNAGWCWIHDPRQNGPNAHRCYVFLKNWPEQRHERVGIPDFACGTQTIRLVADDCTIFPFICADILCAEPNGAHERIAESIRASHLDRNKVLIPILMLDGNPSNPVWRSRLAAMIQAAPLKVAIVTCNHVSVLPLSNEDNDQVRCLSGALVGVPQFSPDHKEILHPVRPLILPGFAGYVLRSSAPGVAAGDFIWREVGLENRFIWLPNWRATLEGTILSHEMAEPVQVEMQRWCGRVRRPSWLDEAAPASAFLDAGYRRLRLALGPTGTGHVIWPEALNGRGLDEEFAFVIDDAGKNLAVCAALDEAYLIAGSVAQTPGFLFEPFANPGHFCRPASAERAARDIIIWSSPNILSDHQFETLQQAALDGRYQRAVVVVARGAGGNPPSFRRVTTEATTDFTSGPPSADGDDIAEPPPANVFWMPIGDLQELLAREDWTEIPQDQHLTRIGLAVETLLNRIAA